MVRRRRTAAGRTRVACRDPARGVSALAARDVAPARTAPMVGRLEWVDAVRGYSVVAVVLAHVVLWHLLAVDAPTADAGESVWGRVYGVLGSARMPVLLAVSGLVVARRVRLGWRPGGLTLRVARNYYLYVVWLLLYAVFYAVVRDPSLPHRVDGVGDLLRQLVVPETTLWYVFALAVYIAVLGALHRVPPWAVLSGLVALCLATHVLTSSDQMWAKVPEMFLFFAVGVYGAGPLRRLGERASWGALLLAAGLAVAATASGRLAEGVELAEAVVFVVRCLAFLVLAVLVVVLAVRWEPLRRLGLLLGRQTLPIYVLHPLWLALLLAYAGGLARDVTATTVGSLLYPPVVTTLVVVLSLTVHAGARHAHALVPAFAMPRRWEERLAAVDARAPGRPAPVDSGRGA
ncbi:acyltransferase family protein [Cellulomonas palmilytica]|uniref:acyltransferase family protein n=1 Tax=Cellulomonas palmilytica TaxID=2608402 RepID=UPI001F47769A|nr:acyltransferase family protein [Cellulomonas palmilytica]UJP41140.1 acyltransferase family protein [Cellulomonas palmilytica]